jgi:hypothetical protein
MLRIGAADSNICGSTLVAAGATLLEKLHEELQQQGIQLGLCNPGGLKSLLAQQNTFLSHSH